MKGGRLLCSKFGIVRHFSAKPISSAPSLKPDDPSHGNFPSVAASGSLHQFLLAKHRELGPIFTFWWGKQQTVSVNSAHAFKSLVGLKNRPKLLFSLFEPLIGAKSLQYANDADFEARMKQYVRPVFSHSNLANGYGALTSTALTCVEELNKAAESNQPVPLRKTMLSVAIRAVGQAVFGVTFTPTELDELQLNYQISWGEMEARARGAAPPVAGDARDVAFKKSLAWFKEATLRVAEQSRQSPNPKSLVALLAKAQVSDEQLVSEVITFLVGGFHTTGNALTWSFIHLARNLEAQAEARAEAIRVLQGSPTPTFVQLKELSYTEQVIEETLRCSVLGPWAARYADNEIELEGFTVPARTPIMIHLGGALQRPEVWPQPQEFDPNRFCEHAMEERKVLGAFTFTPFGFGRVCPGKPLSNMEMKVVLPTVLQQFQVSLVDPHKPIVPDFGFITTPTEEVYVRFAKC